MCHATKCSKCGKTTWSGCGQHVESVFRNVPVGQRCFCGFSEDEKQYAAEHPQSRAAMPKGAGCVTM